jgi:hypothetical protein
MVPALIRDFQPPLVAASELRNGVADHVRAVAAWFPGQAMREARPGNPLHTRRGARRTRLAPVFACQNFWRWWTPKRTDTRNSFITVAASSSCASHTSRRTREGSGSPARAPRNPAGGRAFRRQPGCRESVQPRSAAAPTPHCWPPSLRVGRTFSPTSWLHTFTRSFEWSRLSRSRSMFLARSRRRRLPGRHRRWSPESRVPRFWRDLQPLMLSAPSAIIAEP